MILTLCPTKSRPKECLQMLRSFRETSTEKNHIWLLFNDDENFEIYEECFKYIDYHIGLNNPTVTQLLNTAYNMTKDYNYVHIANDDVLYLTPGWDTKFKEALKAPGIAYGDDLFQGENLCTFPFISKEIVDAVGWVQMPLLEKYSGDVVWKFIGNQLNILKYIPEIIISHQWKGCSDQDLNKKDMNSFAEWLKISHRDIKKINEILK